MKDFRKFFHRIKNESEYEKAIFKLSANFSRGWGNPHIYGNDLKYEDGIDMMRTSN